MRALALVTDAFGAGGGVAQAARDVLTAITAIETVRAVEVHPRIGPEAASGLPEKLVQHPALANRVAYSRRALAAAWTRPPDVVFCNHLYMAPLAAAAARLSGAALVVQLHGVEVWPTPTPLRRRALEQADFLLCVSRDTRARVLSACNVQPEKAVVLNNTVDARFRPGDRAAARSKFGLGDAFALLSVGRLSAAERYKGHDRVLNALPEVSGPDGREIVYLIAGDGDDRARLEAAAEASGAGARVRFLGKAPDADLPDLYRACDLFVLPSTGEGFGIVFLEAMACGAPALGLRAGGAPDALADGALGHCVDPEDDFTAALAEAVLSPPKATPEALSQAVEARFGQKVFREQVGRLLAQLPARRA